MQRLLLGVTIGVLIAAPATASAACSTPTDVARAISEASTVFVGEVVATSKDGTSATMGVVSIWKGRDLPVKTLLCFFRK